MNSRAHCEELGWKIHQKVSYNCVVVSVDFLVLADCQHLKDLKALWTQILPSAVGLQIQTANTDILFLQTLKTKVDDKIG